MTRKQRLFFALEPGKQVRQEVHDIQLKLDAQGRMIPAAQFHITVAFLGMQSVEVLPSLYSIASRLSFPACTLVLDRLGTFHRAAVLWLGATVIPAPLRDFHQDLLDGLNEAGISFDQKAWKPHLTLYRRLRKRPGIMATVPVNWQLDQFSLIESINVKNGVEYHPRGNWKSGS